MTWIMGTLFLAAIGVVVALILLDRRGGVR